MSKVLNFLHFHRRRVAVNFFTASCYGALCYSGKEWNNDLLRLGIAGSISNMIVETSFHFIDTLNIRTKASEKSITAGKMMSKIWEKEGIKGFGKGFSACFYGSCLVGFIQFYFYKNFKTMYKEYFEGKVDLAFIYSTASLSAMCLTLSV